MANITIKYNPIQTIGYVSCNVPNDVLAVVKQEVQELIDTNFKDAIPYNEYLAGAIKKEYVLTKSTTILNKFFKSVIPEYFKLQGDLRNANITFQINNKHINGLSDLWVNLQKKYEINPIHDHSGSISFVLYLKIPYDLKEEEAQPHWKNSNHKVGPSFSFIFPAIPQLGIMFKLVEEHFLKVDQNWEGTMIIFPSWMQHMVYPFYTSDDYRISVSGNLIPQE